jgi:tetrathionate reductase subunit A
MDENKRKLLGAGAVILGAGAVAAAVAGTGKKLIDGIVAGTAGEAVRDPLAHNALSPEYTVAEDGKVSLGEHSRVAFNHCWGCCTMCGVRLHIDEREDKVVRAAGNPYNPLSSSHAVPMSTSVSEALRGLSARTGEDEPTGHERRSTVCGRGAAMIDASAGPFRITRCLKRAGKRGEGRWQSIAFEQLVEEVVEGGDLFGEGHVDGLRAIREPPGPANPACPEFGPHANRLLLTYALDDGRERFFFQRFGVQAYGTRNFGKHGAYCGLSFRMGAGLVLNDLATNTHAKPDFENCEFALFWGTAPGQAGNPFKHSARMVAEARTNGKLRYAVIDPVLRLSATDAVRDRARWVPVRPDMDAALAMGMIRWILENKRHDASFLCRPTLKAATDAGEAAYSNATHLVCLSGPLQGKILRMPTKKAGPDGKSLPGEALVAAPGGGILPADQCAEAELFFRGEVPLPDGTTVTAATALQLLKEEAFAHEIEEYAALCGVPGETIIDLAREFTAHGKRAAADCHGGMMTATGMNAAFAVLTLNTLIGNLNAKGGICVAPGNFHWPAYAGPRYNLADFPGRKDPKGFPANRCRAAYEKSTAHRRKVEAGQNPYPADMPWFPLTAPNLPAEHLLGHANGYPFTFKCWINWTGNVVYGHGGLRQALDAKLKDPADLPLIVGIDAFHNETNAYADYLVPDPCMYEVWGGFAEAWSGVLTRMSTARWPAVEPRQEKSATGEPVCMELFVIEAAKRMHLPGFGDKAVPDAGGTLHPLNTPQDYYLRLAANMAFFKGKTLPAPSGEDVRLSGIARIMPDIASVLKPEEQGPVACIYSRGGRYDPFSESYEGNAVKSRWTRAVCVYNEEAASAVHSQTGRRYSGIPRLRGAEFTDGTLLRSRWTEKEYPFLMISFKSNLINSYAVVSPRLLSIKPVNMVLMHIEDARALGVENGDTVRLVTPGGRETAQATVTDGIMRGVVGVEHGFGHKALGARDITVDGKRIPAVKGAGAGLNLNDLVPGDPSRQGISTLTESDTGSAVRQGIPLRVEKIA